MRETASWRKRFLRDAFPARSALFKDLDSRIRIVAPERVVGTLGGAAIRGRLAEALGKDLPAVLLEDVVAIVISIVALSSF
ncbi:MAG TPA: hypothetical protein VNO32_45940 [Candidatus Acidoferrum sp.]|nr:hypothetical protein [Candidatus Acidoferrum sp.]